jgi:type IV pilus assembly protein PilB
MSPEPSQNVNDAATSNIVGQLLVEAGMIDADGLVQAREVQDRFKLTIGKAIAHLGLADEEGISAAIARHLNIDYLGADVPEIASATTELLSAEFCRKRQVVPLGMQGSSLRVAIADPFAYHTIQDVELITGHRTITVAASQTSVQHLLNRFYPLEKITPSSTYELLLMDAAPSGQLDEIPERESRISESQAREQSKQIPVVRMVNLVLTNAVRDGVSDIQFERHEDFLQVRYRVDGLLQDVLKIPEKLQEAVISRLKISAGLSLAERHKPQDGRGQLSFKRGKIPMRVSTLPGQFGESVVVHLLGGSITGLSLDELGFYPQALKVFKSMLSSPQGLILLTGPTGSGKTTALYSALRWLQSPARNIITIEDPIECRLPGIHQIEISPKAGLTFADSLRPLLRQEPGVIFVGEIRDPETAKAVFAAAQAGHLLLSTLHTHDATGSIHRLVDLGIDPAFISSSLLGVVAQRLVRKNCPACSVAQAPSLAAVERAGGGLPEDARWMAGSGCEKCRHSGYHGQLGVQEVMRVNEEIRHLIAVRAAELAIRNVARRSGMRTMMEDGIQKGAEGLTTLEEIVRVIARDETPVPAEEVSWQPAPDPPASKARVAGAEVIPIAGPGSSRGKARILVVEDSLTVASVVKYYLEMEGFEMLLAPDGRSGLEIARRERPDVVVTDLYMPDMDGIALVKALRADPGTRDCAILMLTTETSIEIETQALSAGADDYINKPVEPRRLAARVKTILGRSGKQRAAQQ